MRRAIAVAANAAAAAALSTVQRFSSGGAHYGAASPSAGSGVAVAGQRFASLVNPNIRQVVPDDRTIQFAPDNRIYEVAPDGRTYEVPPDDWGATVAITYTFDEKDPTDTDGFTFDLSAWLRGDSISGTPAASVVGGTNDLTVNTTIVNGSLVTVWLSGGTSGVTYSLYIVIITAGGRHCKRGGKVPVVAL